jgi:hypothetical protein
MNFYVLLCIIVRSRESAHAHIFLFVDKKIMTLLYVTCFLLHALFHCPYSGVVPEGASGMAVPTFALKNEGNNKELQQ